MGENGAIKKFFKASLKEMLDVELTELWVMKNTHPLDRILVNAAMVKPTRLSRMIAEKLNKLWVPRDPE